MSPQRAAPRAAPAGGGRDAVLVRAQGLRKDYGVGQGTLARLLGREAAPLAAVDGVSLEVRRGEALGLVGESGCGKSTLGRLLLRLVEPTAGRVWFDGEDITALREAELRHLRRRMQPVFQDAHAALNPAMTVGEAVEDGLRVHGHGPAEARARALAALEEVGVSPARDLWDRRPGDLSGGQQQRVVLARALALEPEFLVLDEPVSMLDMSVRARVLELLRGLRRRRGLTLLFITHDLAAARLLCDRVAIMYLGQIVEEGPVEEVFRQPLHPYTRALLDAVPAPDPAQRARPPALRGEVPDAARPPAGCRFHPRCPVSEARCGFGPDDLAEAWEAALAAGKRIPVQPPGRWRRSHQQVLLANASLVDVQRVARYGVPGLRAAMQPTQEGPDVVVQFPPAEPVAERRLGERRARCLLVGDAEHPPHQPR